MKPAKKVAYLLNNNTEIILNLLTQNMIDKYLYLQSEYCRSDISKNIPYQKMFRSYYKMRYPNKQYVERFFELFEVQKDTQLSFEELSLKLYEIEQKHQFSFISKLLHTINPQNPIFDKFVGEVLEIKRTAGCIHNRIIEDKKILCKMSELYETIEQEHLIDEIIKDFDNKFVGNSIPFFKKIDFLLWGYGKVFGTNEVHEKPGDIE